MRQQARLMVVGLMVLAVATFVVGVSAAPAHACSLDGTPMYELRISDLEGADPAAPMAHLQDAYSDWLEATGQAYNGGLPDLETVWFERTMAVVDPLDDDFIADGGVSVVESVWGSTAEIDPINQWWLDDSSCAGLFPIPTFYHFQLRTETYSALHLVQPRGEEAVQKAHETLNAVFGSPTVMDVPVGDQQVALDEVLERGARLGRLKTRLPHSQSSLVAPGAGLWKPPGGWLVWLASSVVLVGGTGLAVARRLRRAGS